MDMNDCLLGMTEAARTSLASCRPRRVKYLNNWFRSCRGVILASGKYHIRACIHQISARVDSETGGENFSAAAAGWSQVATQVSKNRCDYY